MPRKDAPEAAAAWHPAKVVMAVPQPEQSVAPDGARTKLPQPAPHVLLDGGGVGGGCGEQHANEPLQLPV